MKTRMALSQTAGSGAKRRNIRRNSGIRRGGRGGVNGVATGDEHITSLWLRASQRRSCASAVSSFFFYGRARQFLTTYRAHRGNDASRSNIGVLMVKTQFA